MPMNFARLLMLPFLMGAILVAYRVLVHGFVYDGIYFLICIICVVTIGIFAPQINWVFWQKYPPQVSKKLRSILLPMWPELDDMGEGMQRMLWARIILYAKGNDIDLIGVESTPVDIQCMVGLIPVKMTAHLEGNQYLLAPYEKVVLYQGLFLSPDKKYPHSSETNHKESVVIFSFKHLIDSMREPHKYFPIGYYEYSGVYIRKFPELNYPKLDEERDLASLEYIVGFSRKHLLTEHALKEPDLQQLGMTAFWCFPERFKEKLPKVYEQYDREVFGV